MVYGGWQSLYRNCESTKGWQVHVSKFDISHLAYVSFTRAIFSGGGGGGGGDS